MGKTRNKWVAAVLEVAVGTMLFAGSSFAEENASDVVVLFTSDVHCGVDQGFGYAGLYAVRESLENEGDQVILVDDGDSIQGEPLGTVTKGEAIIELMNTMKYDVAIPGNHEFDYGMDRFLELTKEADFPYISANFEKDGELVFDPYVIIPAGDLEIAFVGVTTPTTITSSTPKYFQNEDGVFIYDFMQDETGEKLVDGVQKAVDDARAEGADYVVVMGHMGNSDDSSPYTYVDLLSKTNGIDAMLDGHSHDTDQVEMKNKDGQTVLRSACGTKLQGIGYLRIAADGTLSTGLYTWNNSVSAPELLGITNEAKDAVDEKLSELGADLMKVVANTSVELTINDPEATRDDGSKIRIVRNAETNLGDLCADAYRNQCGTDIGFVNGGGVRASIPAGAITVNDIMKVHPFGNMICVAQLKGQQILDALEWSVRSVPEESGGFLQVSGISFEINTEIESSVTSDENGMFTGVAGERRVQNVMVGEEALDPEKTYTVASTEYMLKNNGDGYSMFDTEDIIQDCIMLDNQALIDYITDTLGGVVGDEYADPYGQGRIVAVTE